MENSISDMHELSTGNLVVGIPTLLNGYLLPEGYMSFKDKYPGVHVEIFEDDSVRLEQLLKRGKIDLAIMSLPIDSSLLSTQLISCDMVICAPYWYEPGDAYDPKTNMLDLRTLDGQPFIFPRPNQKLSLVTEPCYIVPTGLDSPSSQSCLFYFTLPY